MPERAKFQHQVKLGVGEAIRRLIQIEFQYRQGASTVPKALLSERAMIISALNQFELNVGFDCNNDGMPDTVEIFSHSVATSCCRLLPLGKIPADTSRIPPPDSAEPVLDGTIVEDAPKRGLRGLFNRKGK